MARPETAPEVSKAAEADRPPRFSVILPVWHPEPDHLRQCIESVVGQTYDGWQLLIVADGPQPPAVTRVLADFEPDPRVRVIRLDHNVGIGGASQAALEAAGEEFIALLDHDDVLSPHALGAFAAELALAAPVDLAYSDEDKLEHGTGERKMPFYKPGFSMERLRCQMYLGHLLVMRRTLALEVGGFRGDYDGAQDHDLALRVAEQARSVVHIPRILYHWRESPASTALDTDSKEWAWEAGRMAVADHLRRTGFPAEAVASPVARGVVDLEPRLVEHPLVSIIIPTGGTSRIINGAMTLLVERAVSSLVERSSYPNVEIVVVLDASCDDALVRRIAAAARRSVPVVLLRDGRPFNFADACNIGAVRSNGEVLIFLNDDTEVRMANWIERLVMYATRPDIGAVGVKLLYGDGRVQHAGVWARGGPAHRYVGFRGDHPGNFHALRLAQNCLAVTAACLAVGRDRFDEVGGFSSRYPLAYNDVDLCFKLLQKGYRNVVDCATEVVHHESSSRDPTVREWEIDLLRKRWRPLLMSDPFDNPANLAAGVDEYPSTPVDIVERKAARGELVLAGRRWPDRDFYNLGGRWHG
ncbi:MAG: glycosyltransferase [Acidimicrobiia bacterium]|nr:glycosyltransferase [Acidimicrobiia bacterium]